MERNVPKQLLIALVATALALALSLSLFFFFLKDGSFGGVFLTPSLSLSVELEGEPLWQEGSVASLAPGNHTLRLENGEGCDLTLHFFAGADFLGEAQVGEGETADFSFTLSETSAISAVVLGKDIARANLTSGEALAPAAALMPQGGDLVFFGGVTCPSVTLAAPFRLFGAYHFTSLSLETEAAGSVVLFPDTSFEGNLYISAPNCQIYFRNFSLASPKASTDFYIKAKKLNGARLNAAAYPITSWEELSRLGDENTLPHLCEGAVITFSSAFQLEEDVTLPCHAELNFQSPLDFGDARLILTSDTPGDFRVVTGTGTAPAAASILFFAPASSLTWESDGTVTTVPALTTVEKYSNLAAYNGVSTMLGGEGQATPTVTLPASENGFLDEDVTFLADGNRLVGLLPYEVSAEDLNGASYHLSATGGSAMLEGDLAYGRIVTVDENGKERRFALDIDRQVQNIPVLYLETEGAAEITSKSQYLSATLRMDGEGTAIESLAETHIRVRGRGNSTWKWDKKPYKIHFDEPVSILGLPAAEEWALFSNYADKSLMRNRLAQKMASVLSFEYCPTQEYVDLFINGEYMGVYTIGEHLEEGTGRVEVQHDMTQMDCGYYLEAGGVVSGVDVKGMNYFHAGLVKFVLVKGPEYNTLTSEQFDFIKDYMQAADLAVKNGEGYEEYLDMDTLVDWLIMIELTNNTDCAWRRSTYFTKNPGEKLKMGPVWDFDLAFGNFSKDVEGFNTWVSTSEDDYVGETWSTHLLQDPEFQALFKARWNQVKDQLLECAMTTIDEDYQTLYPSAKANFERWDILGKKVAFERHDTKYYKTYSSQIEYLKEFLINRAAWIDEQLEAW